MILLNNFRNITELGRPYYILFSSITIALSYNLSVVSPTTMGRSLKQVPY